MNNWILFEVIDNLKFRLNTLENMMQDEVFQPIYKSAMKQEINWIKEQLSEIENMMIEDIKRDEEAEEDLREKRADAYI